jgi:mRNA interferase RelE/StbE
LSTDYRSFETDHFQKEITRQLRDGKENLYDKLTERLYPPLRRRLYFGPNIKKLRDYSPETWRYRIGPWRFFYEIDEQERIVFLTAASHRSRAY